MSHQVMGESVPISAGRGFELKPLEQIKREFDFTTVVGDVFDGTRAPAWKDYCKSIGLYEYPTEEFVHGLGSYLCERVSKLEAEQGGPVRVSEIVAGTGLLSQLLNAELAEAGVETTIVASDDKSWEEETRRGKYQQDINLELMDYTEALERQKPHIVIASWVPSDMGTTEQDWSEIVRSHSSVKEYLMIGKEKGSGGFHGGFEAWGYGLGVGEDSIGIMPVETPKYVADGFERVDIDELREFQLCFLSHEEDMHPSRTVSFRRTTPADS